MSETIEVTRMIPAKPDRIFSAWLSGEEHGLMIGSTATYDEATGEFTAWDGYISGRTTEQKAGARFVQHWRTTEFPEGVPDSKLEVSLAEVEGGTRVTLLQTEIPDGQGESYEVGWSDHYFDPMTDYFTSARSRLKDAGEAISDVADQVGDAITDASEQATETFEAVGAEVTRAAKKVQKSAKQAGKKLQASTRKTGKKLQASAKKAGKQVKKLVATAKKKLAAAGRKTKKKPAAKKGKARRAAPKKKAARGKKRR